MTITADPETGRETVVPMRTWRINGRQIPVKGPSIRDPRIHLAFTILSIIVIGMVWLDFRLSIPQFALAFVTCGLIELRFVYRQTGMLVWPASGFQTATATALILRVTGMQPHDWWSFDGWYYFVAIAGGGLLTKYFIRYRGRHIFNPSNVGLVVAFIVLGADRIEPLDYWWGPFGWAIALAYTVIIVGGITLCRRVRMLEMALAFYVTFAIGVGVLGSTRPVDHRALGIDADQRIALLVDPPDLARDADLPVLHDHRPEDHAGWPARADHLRHRRRRDVDTAAGSLGNRVRHQGRPAEWLGRHHSGAPIRRTIGGRHAPRDRRRSSPTPSIGWRSAPVASRAGPVAWRRSPVWRC